THVWGRSRILQLTVDSSPQSGQALQNRLVELVDQTPVEGTDERAAQAFIAHARLLEHLVPSVDDTLKALFACRPDSWSRRRVRCSPIVTWLRRRRRNDFAC